MAEEGDKIEVYIPIPSMEYYRQTYAPPYIEGVRVLVIVVSEATANIDFIPLLKATYGEDNVDVYGCGYEGYVVYGKGTGQMSPAYPEPQRAGQRKDFAGYDYISLYEFARIVRSISDAGGSYDQVHVLGHGDPSSGLLVRTGRFVQGVPSAYWYVTREMLEEELGGIKWPLTSEAKVVLAGCDTGEGVLPAYFGRFVGPANVHVVEGIFNCRGIDFPIRQPDGSIITRRLPVDWYNENQFETVTPIAEFLGIPMIKPARPLRRLEVIVNGQVERVDVEQR
jgi:hypothetical protein